MNAESGEEWKAENKKLLCTSKKINYKNLALNVGIVKKRKQQTKDGIVGARVVIALLSAAL